MSVLSVSTETFAIVEFQGEEYLGRRAGDESPDYPLVKREAYQRGECSFAHVDSDRVMRFRQKIGEPSEIKFLRFEEVKVNPLEFLGGLLGETWLR